MKRKIGFGLLLYLLVGLVGYPLQFLKMTLLQQLLLSLAVVFILGFLLGKMYFKKAPGDFKAGVILGLIWILIATVLDLIFLLPLFFAGDPVAIQYLVTLYGSWPFAVSVLVLLGSVGLAGHVTHGGALIKSPATKPVAVSKEGKDKK